MVQVFEKIIIFIDKTNFIYWDGIPGNYESQKVGMLGYLLAFLHKTVHVKHATMFTWLKRWDFSSQNVIHNRTFWDLWLSKNE